MDFVIESRSKQRRQIIESFGREYAKFLNIDKKSATVYISLRKDVGSEYQSDGLTLGFDRDIFIFLQSTNDVCDLLRTLAHEMVHAKQLIRGQLKRECIRGKVNTYWCGRKTNKNYLEQPWEVEAFCKEVLLFRRAIDSLDKD